MKTKIIVLAAAAVAAVSVFAVNPRDVTESEIAAALAKAPKTHPRLFATDADFAALKKRMETDDLTRRAAERVIKEADARLKRKMPVHRLVGFRMLDQARETLHNCFALAMAYRLTGDAKYRDGALAIVRTVIAFEDWNPKHFLDVSEFSLGVSVAYDWLYADLDDSTRAEIEKNLVRLALDPSFEKGNWWIKGKSNWTSVCHAGQIAAALSVKDSEPKKSAAAIHRAIVNLVRPAEVFGPHGAYPEGPGYWNYGAGFHVLALAMIEGAFGTDFGLGDVPGWKETADYLDLMTGPTGLYFNYSDSGFKRGTEAATWWFAKRYNRPDAVTQFELPLFEQSLAGRGVDRLFPLALIWMDGVATNAAPRSPLTWRSEGVPQLAVQRSGWTKDAFFVALKAGTPSENHGHMDGGTFVMDAAGVRWAWDLGGDGYHNIEKRGMSLWSSKQTSDRWRVFRLSNFAHNTLVIDNSLQLVKGVAKTLPPVAGREDEAVLDLTPLYTNATKVVRTGRLAKDGKSYRLVDRVEGVRAGAPIRWAMATKAKVTVDGADVVLSQDGKKLRLAQTQGAKCAWQMIEEPQPNEWDTPNKGVRQITFTVAAPESGTAEFGVNFSLE